MCEMTVTETDHPPYQGMVTGHVIVLHSNRTNVRGSVERIREKTESAPVTEYSSEGIIEGEVDGYHEDRLVFLRKRDKLQLVVKFDGAIRSPTFYWNANELSKDRIYGQYESTVSQREKGTFECERPGP